MARSGRSRKIKVPAPGSVAQYYANPERFGKTSFAVAKVISKMRDEGKSLHKAAQEERVSPETVKRWAGSSLQKRSNGKWLAKKRDRLLRNLMILSPDGKREIIVRGSGKATQISEHWNAANKFLSTGDASGLAKFVGKRITAANGERISFITDRALLNRLGSPGRLSFESIYARSA